MIGTIWGNKYKIIELIGSGGMALVYLAENIYTHKTYAVKMLKSEYAENTEFLRRFELEARSVLKLSDPNIVRAFDVGEQDGIPFIILEYVKGRTLKEVLTERGALPQGTACVLFSQILSALNSAHKAGIIHRDVKPQNVLITSELEAKLTDFGIARDVQATTVTFAGSTVLGSAHYISPEQAQGLPVTISSDIYSAGVMLYEMLTGTVPFTSDSTVSVALKHISDTAIPPIELNPSIYPSVNEVVLRALNKDPKERFSSARQMLLALKRALKDPNAVLPAVNPDEQEEYEDRTGDSPFSTHNPHWSWRIATVVLLVVITFIAAFFGIRSTFSDDAKGNLNPVPSLIGKPLQEAMQKSADYGYTLRIEDYVLSPDVPYGSVVTQSPDAGKVTSFSGEIIVTVSSGSESPTVPLLTGKTLDESRAALAEKGLEIGHITYQVSDIEIGFVCGQFPAAGTELSPGTNVDLIISSTRVSSLADMPDLVSYNLSDALHILQNMGFTRIYIKYDSSRPESVILSQTPAPSESVSTDTRLILTAGINSEFKYSSDIAFNIDISESGTDIMVTLPETLSGGIHVERILYHAVLEKGDRIPISFTAGSNEKGIAEIILYVNGYEYRRQDTDFESITDKQ